MERAGDVMSFDPPFSHGSTASGLSRRRFVQGLALGGVVAASGLWRYDARPAAQATTPV
ncbi:twin-arginine translocation signal domain-containing protein, partial [Xanthomonas perforans]|uniref:twin-arginine translocation signal domain-containing protein n=1 Tax=Xanthomonas perforans TaxID=442694 RepID=UPI001F3BC5A4